MPRRTTVTIVIATLALLCSSCRRSEQASEPGERGLGIPLAAASLLRGPGVRGGGGLTGRVTRVHPVYHLQWRKTFNGRLLAAPLLLGDAVYTATDRGEILAWPLDGEGPPRTLALGLGAIDAGLAHVDGHLFGASLDGEVFAVDLASGRRLWVEIMGGEVHSAPNLLDSPSGPLLVWGDYRHRLFALAPGDGRLVWQYEAPNTFNGTPAVADNLVVGGNCDGRIYLLSGQGALVREIDTGAYVPGSVALVGGAAIATNYAGEVLSLSLSSGAENWRRPFAGQGLPGSPAVTRGTVLVSAETGEVAALALDTGEFIWQRQVPAQIRASILADDAHFILAGMDGRLRVLSVSDGRPVWEYHLGAPLSLEPALSGGLLAAVTDQGELALFAAGGTP